jgi:hypothetical protein
MQAIPRLFTLSMETWEFSLFGKLRVSQECRNCWRRVAWENNFVPSCLIFVGPQYWPCLMSFFWRIKFWGGFYISEKEFVGPWLKVTILLRKRFQFYLSHNEIFMISLFPIGGEIFCMWSEAKECLTFTIRLCLIPFLENCNSHVLLHQFMCGRV